MTRCFRRSAFKARICMLAVCAAGEAHAAACPPPASGATSYVADGCDGTVAGGTFDTGATANALVFQAVNNGSITTTAPVTLRAGGDGATGAYASAGGAIRLDAPGSTLSLSGADARGVHASGTGAVVSGQAAITTTGASAHAALATDGGLVQLRDSVLATQGQDAAGIAVSSGRVELLGASAITTTGLAAPGVVQTGTLGSVLVDGQAGRASIRTTGREAPGVAVLSPGNVHLRNVDVLSENDRSYGLFASGVGASVTTENTTVQSLGRIASAVEVLDGASARLVGGSVAATAAVADGISVLGPGSRVDADGTTVTVSGLYAYGIRVRDGSTFTLSNGAIEATGLYGVGVVALGINAPTMQTVTLSNTRLSTLLGPALTVSGGNGVITLTDATVSGAQIWLDVEGDRQFETRADVTASRSTLRGTAILIDGIEGVLPTTSNVTLRDRSTWWVTGHSRLTRLDNVDSTVAFTPPVDGIFPTLTVRDYAGSGGTLVLSAALGGDGSPANRLVVNGGTASGATALRVVNAGGAGALTSEGIRVVEVTGGGSAPAGTFALAGRAVAGPYEYRLYRGGVRQPDDGNWYLRSQQMPDPPTPPDPPVPPIPPSPPAPPDPPRPLYRPEVPAYIANEHAAATLFQHSLHDRMGQLQFSGAPAAWLRLAGKTGESGSRGHDYSARADTVVLQGGGDIARGSLFGAADRLHLGAMLGYGHVQTDGLAAGNSARAKGEVNGYGVGLYATWFGQATTDLGPYVDTWFQYAWFDSNVRGDQLPKVDYRSQAWNASVEAGWALPLGATPWRVEPQAQAVWVRHRGVSVNEPGGTQVTGGDTKGVVTRLGMRVFRTLERDDGGRLQPYATLNWWHDRASTSIGFSDTVLGQLFPRDRYEVKLGLAARMGRGWTSWGNVGGQWGSQGYRQYALRLGARYAW